ncbi:MAG: glycosyltransferase [Stenomitos rutilans HA7619-LM2]|jgi:dolichol-phosphate mannosyltransferase|nr:glycosyltransferase [Stenomitos rutilans HA7619-LM2]
MVTTGYTQLLPELSGLLQVPSQATIARQALNKPPEAVAGAIAPVRFSLVVPTYNESRNIERIVALLSDQLDAVLPHRYEIIVVDDDSPDDTWQIAERLTAHYPHLRVMRRQTERGLSTAVIRGWQAAQGDIVGVIDGDLQHPPEVLQGLLGAIEQGADLAVASRNVDGGGVSTWSAMRRFLSRGAQLLGLVLLPDVVSRVSDPMSGYFLVRRSAIAEQALHPLGYKILLEVLGRGRIEQIAEVGYVFQEREAGESKVTWKQYRDYIRHLIRLRISLGRLGRFRQRFNFPLGRFLRFAFVGLSGLVVDMGLLYLLHGTLGFGLTRSAIVAAELAIINNFVWNDRWTFGDLAQQQQKRHQVLKRFVKFNLICLMGLILKILILNLLFNGLHLNAYLANLLAIIAVTLWNFWINLKLSWRVTQVK